MRSDAAGEHVVAVGEQVLRRDGGADVLVGTREDKLGRLLGRHVLEDHLEARRALEQLGQPSLHKDALAIEDVDGRVGDLSVDAEGQAVVRHRLERARGGQLGVVGH